MVTSLRTVGIAIAVSVAVGGFVLTSLYWAAGRQFSAQQGRANDLSGLVDG